MLMPVIWMRRRSLRRLPSRSTRCTAALPFCFVALGAGLMSKSGRQVCKSRHTACQSGVPSVRQPNGSRDPVSTGRRSGFPIRSIAFRIAMQTVPCTSGSRHCRRSLIRPCTEDDRLHADLRALQSAQRMIRSALSECPGLRRIYANLTAVTRQLRRPRSLPRMEAAVEAAILHLLGAAPPKDALALKVAAAVHGQASDLAEFQAPRGYRPFMPVALWPDLRPMADRLRVSREDETTEDGQAQHADEERIFKATRKSADQATRKDSLVLHKFEAIFSWAEFLNLNRRIEDNDEDTAKKAADDQEEISLTQVPQKARARLRLHLDLSPEEAEFERLAGRHVYPEWDHRKKDYLPDYCRVLAGQAKPAEETPEFLECAKTKRRIRSVRRQFRGAQAKTGALEPAGRWRGY